MTLRIVLTDGSGVSGLTGVFGAFLRSSNQQIQQAVAASQAAALASQTSATQSDQSAQQSALSAGQSANSASLADASADAAAISESNAGAFATSASNSASAASISASAADISKSGAQVSASNASLAAILAQQWATQMTGMVSGVDYSAKYYAAQAAASAASIALPIVANSGGTGRTSLTANAVLAGDGTNPVKQIGPGTNGQMLLGVTSGAPVFGNNPTITGGTVDNAVIGGTTPKAATFTGATIKGANPNLVLDDNPAGGFPEVIFKKNGVQQWGLYGDNATPAFYLIRYNASGSYVSTPWKTDWNTGVTTFESRPVFNGQTPYDTGNLPLFTGKNRLINGNCLVQQRPAILLTAGQTNYGQVDRFKGFNSGSTGTFTLGSQAGVTNNLGVSIPAVTAKIGTAFPAFSAAQFIRPIYQLIEGFNCYDLVGKQFTICGWIRATIPGNYAVAVRDSAASVTCVKLVNVTAANTVQYFKLVFPTLPLTATVPYASGTGLSVSFASVSGTTNNAPSTDIWVSGSYESVSSVVNWTTTSNNFVDLYDVQLLEGTDDTPFERRSYSEILGMCERYYQVAYPQMYVYGSAGSTMGAPFSYTPMRVNPTVAFITAPSYVNASGASVAGIVGGKFAILLGIVTAAGPAIVNASGGVSLNAEL